ncbi:MAG: hypothetical protein K8R77_10765 [Anaerolineaceae bacterium]|nr:hypothetical protein [Anaerolineaceae bacterium]
MDKMPEDELRGHILSFLVDMKELISQGDYDVKTHYKNRQTLIDLGLNNRLREGFLLSLTLPDYSSGPTPDEYKPGHYWVFGTHIDGIEIYIKLKIVTYNDGNERAICFSFHAAEHSLNYPFRY